MESFGLFDLLKSLFLSVTQNSTSNQSFNEKNENAPTEQKTEASVSDDRTAKAQASADSRTENSASPSQKGCLNNASNACLDYFNRHDELSRRHKRK